ncbi:MAG: Ig-like domain-containing protein, partial [Actinobacteria bacterium]|nr:Ig-like domain-containing protein [Actinomycetota bacterium]
SIASISVARAQPAITTHVSSSTVALGESVSDTATLTGGSTPITGTVTFKLYGPNDATCTGPPVFTNTAGVSGGSVASAPFSPTAPGAYRFIATYSGDANNNPVAGVCNAANETVTVLPAGRYVPLTPARILDTRDGTGGIVGPVGPGSTVNVQITGRGGVPATGVSAVAMNVTVTSPTGSGFLTLYPTGTVRPLAANLNFTPGKTVPNLVVVKVGTGGKVDLYNSSGSTQVIFDVAGYFNDSPTGNDGRFVPLDPGRILDTRLGVGAPQVRLGPGASLNLQVAGRGGVPASGAEAVVMNVAATNTDATGFLTVHPTGVPRPLAANLNWTSGATVSNRVIAKLGAGGQVTIYNSAGNTDVIVDVNGWFT